MVRKIASVLLTAVTLIVFSVKFDGVLTAAVSRAGDICSQLIALGPTIDHVG